MPKQRGIAVRQSLRKSWLALQAAYDLKTLPTRNDIRTKIVPRQAA
jgi:plasmid maintenance system antidote protein VapI